MKRPLVAVVFFYIVGLLLARFLQPPPAILFGCAFLVLFLAVFLDRFRPMLTAVLLVLAGWTNLSVRTAALSPHDLRRQIGDEPAIASVRGALCRTPQIRITERDG